MLAVAVSGHPPPPHERAAPARRAARRLRLLVAGVRAGAYARRAETVLERSGLTTRRVGIGDRNDGYEVALAGRRMRRSPEQVVVAGRGVPPPTVLEQILAEAGEALGTVLHTRAVRVLSGGTLMAFVDGDADQAFLLRVEPPGPRPDEPLQRLLACAPPSVVRARLVLPRQSGSLAGYAWSVEERRPGMHPRRMMPVLWNECTSFLEALRAVAVPNGEGMPRSIREDLAVVEPLLERQLAQRLRAPIEHVATTLQDVPRGWGHGDFHPGNLLVCDDRLETVLDWDAAAPSALPLLDLLHLHATTARSSRRRPHGARCTDVLWPLTRMGGDERMREHCRACGLDPDRAVLEALGVAYWLTRVARDVATFHDRAARPEWLRLNLVDPARDLAVRGVA